MKRVFLIIAFLLCIYFISTSLVDWLAGTNANVALVVSGVNQNSLKETIREYFRTSILNNDTVLRDGNDVIDIKYFDLNQDGLRDVVATVHAPETCGSGGCMASIFLQNSSKEFVPTSFMYVVKDIEILNTVTNGMRDLRFNGTKEYRMAWDGEGYQLESTDE